MSSSLRGPVGADLARVARSLHPPITLGAAVARMTAAFREAGLETAGLDARRLVAGVLRIDETVLWREPERELDIDACAALCEVAGRRLAREPVSRILGIRHFHGLAFEIGPATLDPRPETETLVDGVIDLVARGLVPGGAAPRILDLGSGSGAILVALLAALPRATGLGVDVSDAALAVASRNAERHGVADRAELRRSNWLEHVEGRFDLVVSNPPYIPRAELAGLAPEVREHDPAQALDGGVDGLDAYRALLASVPGVLEAAGWLVMEVGDGQADDVASLIAHNVSQPALEVVGIWTDLSGKARCVAARARR